MEHTLRRFKQTISPEACEEILRTCTAGVLSLCGNEMMPYGIPLSYVYHDGRLVFHSAVEGQKLELIKENPKACFTVIARNDIVPEKYTTIFQSVMVFGTIRMISNEAEKIKEAQALGRRFNPGHEDTLKKEIDGLLNHMVMFELVADAITGKQSIEIVNGQ